MEREVLDRVDPAGGSIMDNLTKRDQPDRSKINMHEEYEVKYWTKALGISREELQRPSTRSATRPPRCARSSASWGRLTREKRAPGRYHVPGTCAKMRARLPTVKLSDLHVARVSRCTFSPPLLSRS
jgi:hypothetical protein